jgi:hypothetical protein
MSTPDECVGVGGCPAFKLADAGIGTTSYNTELALTRDDFTRNGILSLGTENATFTGNRKLVLSLTFTFSLLYGISLKKNAVHLEPDPVNPLFMHVYYIPKPSPEEGESVPKKPVPYTKAPINRTDVTSQAATYTT